MGVLVCGVLRTTDGSHCSLRNWAQTWKRYWNCCIYG